MNQGRKKHGIRCTVESTGGSIDNLNSLHEGNFDLGVAQSDWVSYASKGQRKFKKAHKDLRTLFSVHAEPFTVVARADSRITNFSDLKGKRVNIGNRGSGQRGTLDVLMEGMKWNRSAFSKTSELKSSKQSKALCDNQVDAIVFSVGHPNASVKEAVTTCDSVLVNVSEPAVSKLVGKHDYYSFATIPGGMYRGTPESVQSFGVRAVLVASSKVSEQTVYEVVKSVFEHLDTFKKQHPSFKTLKKQDMVHKGLAAPLHAGAKRYYKEVGLL